jgi:hypothetical protein
LMMTASKGDLRPVVQDKGSVSQLDFDISLAIRQQIQTKP